MTENDEPEGGSKARPYKDANDLLQIWAGAEVDPAEQVERVRALLAAAPTVAEEVCRWAGHLKGAERDKGFETAFRMIAGMEKIQRAQYRSKLSDLLGIGIREFNDIAKAAGQEGDKERPMEIVETLGGWYPCESSSVSAASPAAPSPAARQEARQAPESDLRISHNGKTSMGNPRGYLIEYLYNPEEGEGRLAYRDPEGKVGVAEFLDIEGVRYVPKIPDSFIRQGGVLFPSELGALKDTRELVTMVEAFIHEHYLLEKRYLGRIMAYYVMLTWVYDAFNALSYLRAMGDAGAGKSELMRRVGMLCYRFMIASGANTEATFFRATETFKGTVFVDEADLHDGGDMSNMLVKFLNLGAMKGNKIWRLLEVLTENGKSYEVGTFDTFCPKLIAMRKDFRDDAVGSRCLTIRLMSKEPTELKAAGVKLFIDEAFRARALAIRNLLLRWRMEVWRPEIEVGEELMDLEISSRLNQVTMPIKALAKGDPALMAEIERFLREYNREMVLTKSMTIAARVVEAMWKIYRYPDLRQMLLKEDAQGEFMMIGEVRRIANEIMDEMNRGEGEEEEESQRGSESAEGEQKTFKKRKKDELSARGVGAIVRNELQLRVGERMRSGYPVYWDEIKMQTLARRYGVNWESIGINDQGSVATGQPEEPETNQDEFKL